MKGLNPEKAIFWVKREDFKGRHVNKDLPTTRGQQVKQDRRVKLKDGLVAMMTSTKVKLIRLIVSQSDRHHRPGPFV